MVFYERPGDFQGHELAAKGIKTDELVQHWLFITEYQWEVLCKGDQTAKTISIFDLKNVKLTDLAGENMNYVKRTLGYANAHYPERSLVIYLVNAPWYASAGWKLVKPLIHPNTQRKVRILSGKETLTGLMEHIDVSNIPVYYGGQLDYGGGGDSCRFKSPETLEIFEYVNKINEGLPPPEVKVTASTKPHPLFSIPSFRRSSLVDQLGGGDPSHKSAVSPDHHVHFTNDHKRVDEEWSVASVTTMNNSTSTPYSPKRSLDAKQSTTSTNK